MKNKYPLAQSLFILVMSFSLAVAHSEESKKATVAKLHQIGLVWLKDAGDEEKRQKVIDAVHEFGRAIPEVKSAVIGTSAGQESPYLDTSYDLCFILTFEDEESRQRYNEHPVHQKAAQEVFLPLSEKLQFYLFVSQ